jgi:Tfp pilus assembly protein PilN
MAINLLPWRERQARRRQHCYILLLLFGFMTMIAITVFTHSFLIHLRQHYQQQNRALTQRLMTLETPNNTKKEDADYPTLSAQIQFIQSAQLHNAHFWQTLTLLQQHLPKNLKLSRLMWNEKVFLLEGDTIHHQEISELLKFLGKSGLFLQTTLEHIEQKTEMIHFTITAEWAETAIS